MPVNLKPKTSHPCHELFARRRSIVIGLEATRISNILCWHFEQVAFPGEYPMFEAGAELGLFKLGGHSRPLQQQM